MTQNMDEATDFGPVIPHDIQRVGLRCDGHVPGGPGQ